MSRQTILGWVVVAFLSATAQAQMPFPRDLVPTRSALGRLGLERQWMTAVPLTGTERLTEISMADTMVFAQTDYANFYAYDSETGRMLWGTNLGIRTGDIYPADANSKLVFLTNSNYLYALDRGTGRTVWTANLGSLPTSPVACDEDYVVVGLNTGLVKGFDLREHDHEGKIIRDEDGKTKLATRAIPIWNWQTNGSFTSRPLLAGKLVAFGAHDGKLYVALTEANTLLYRFASGGQITASMGSFGTRTMIIPSQDRNVYSVDLFTGTVNWTSPTGSSIVQQPLVSGDEVFVVNSGGMLMAIDIHGGKTLWSVSTHGGRLLSVSAGKVYLETHDDDLFIVDRTTGKTIAEPRATYQRAGLNLRPYELAVVNERNDRLYLGTKSGLVIGLREIGQSTPHLHRDPKEKPFGYIPPEGLPDTQTPPIPPTVDQPITDEEVAPKEADEAKPLEQPAMENEEPK